MTKKLKSLQKKLENENAKKKIFYDIKVFKEYLDTCDEKREIEDITPVELQEKKLKITVSDYSSQRHYFFFSICLILANRILFDWI